MTLMQVAQPCHTLLTKGRRNALQPVAGGCLRRRPVRTNPDCFRKKYLREANAQGVAFVTWANAVVALRSGAARLASAARRRRASTYLDPSNRRSNHGSVRHRRAHCVARPRPAAHSCARLPGECSGSRSDSHRRGPCRGPGDRFRNPGRGDRGGRHFEDCDDGRPRKLSAERDRARTPASFERSGSRYGWSAQRSPPPCPIVSFDPSGSTPFNAQGVR